MKLTVSFDNYQIPPLRLVVAQSLVLRPQRVATLYAGSRTSIGRDVGTDPKESRLRLKDMAVSRLHASIFLDELSRKWTVMDLGSTHGTYFNGSRLSASHQVSKRQELKNGDTLNVGSTKFVVHAHRDGLPCFDCAVVDLAQYGIPLFDVKARGFGAPKRQPALQPTQVACSALGSLLGKRPGRSGTTKVPFTAFIPRERTIPLSCSMSDSRAGETTVPDSESQQQLLPVPVTERRLPASSVPPTPHTDLFSKHTVLTITVPLGWVTASRDGTASEDNSASDLETVAVAKTPTVPALAERHGEM